MTLPTLRRRFGILKRGRYAVMPLDGAIAALEAGNLPRAAVVVTFDDGFAGNLTGTRALLAEFGFPMTLYVTTYYVLKQTPVFRLSVRYMLWKSPLKSLSLAGLDVAKAVPMLEISLRDRSEALTTLWPLVLYAEKHLSEPQRVELARDLAKRLDVDYQELAASRRVSLLSVAEIKALSAVGVDIQLHTHRHRMPSNASELAREIEDNRAVLTAATGRSATHLCYPSGEYSLAQWGDLAALGVRTAATCESGFNGADFERMRLARYLDFEHLTDLEFEAELSGVLEIARWLRHRVRRREPPARASAEASVD